MSPLLIKARSLVQIQPRLPNLETYHSVHWVNTSQAVQRTLSSDWVKGPEKFMKKRQFLSLPVLLAPLSGGEFKITQLDNIEALPDLNTIRLSYRGQVISEYDWETRKGWVQGLWSRREIKNADVKFNLPRRDFSGMDTKQSQKYLRIKPPEITLKGTYQ